MRGFFYRVYIEGNTMTKSRAESGQKGGFAPKWPAEEIQQLIKLYLGGKCNRDIAQALQRSVPQVKGMLSKTRKKLNLPMRGQEQISESRKKTIAAGGKAALEPSQLDRDWAGPVPYCHWTITKPWRKRT
jgi:hypothetical protein